MPRYRVYRTQLVTAGFDIEAATPEAAADDVSEFSIDGELVEAKIAKIEVRVYPDGPGLLSEPVNIWQPKTSTPPPAEDGLTEQLLEDALLEAMQRPDFHTKLRSLVRATLRTRAKMKEADIGEELARGLIMWLKKKKKP